KSKRANATRSTILAFSVIGLPQFWNEGRYVQGKTQRFRSRGYTHQLPLPSLSSIGMCLVVGFSGRSACNDVAGPCKGRAAERGATRRSATSSTTLSTYSPSD